MAREEKTRFGEFLALLKTYDPGLEAELKAGAEEVKEKTGLEVVVPPAAGAVGGGSCGKRGRVVGEEV